MNWELKESLFMKRKILKVIISNNSMISNTQAYKSQSSYKKYEKGRGKKESKCFYKPRGSKGIRRLLLKNKASSSRQVSSDRSRHKRVFRRGKEMNELKKYFDLFDNKFSDLEIIDREWYRENLGVLAFCSVAKTKSKGDKWSEEYFRARFVWSLVQSGMYGKEYICVEFGFPKGNTKTPLKPDIVVFKKKEWLKDFELKNFQELRKNILVIFETKKNSKTVESAIENQLRSAMSENTSKDRIFGVYFDDLQDILIFKKTGNSEIRRFNEARELSFDGLRSWNLPNRDLLIDLPSQKEFIENNESISNLEKLKLGSLDAIDEENFSELMNTLKRADDKIKPKSSVGDLIVEFLTLKIFDEKRSKKNKGYLQFYIKPSEKKKDGLAEKTFRERISRLYSDAKKEYRKVLSKPIFYYDSSSIPSDTNDEKFLIALVETFQKRAILKAKNESFNQIIFNNFGDDKQKADKSQFFTPIPLVKNIIKMINPTKGEELCDPCCGICDFPAMAFRHMNRNTDDVFPTADNFYGFDIEKSNLKLAELNLVLNGDGGATLEQMDSLSQKFLENGAILEEGEFTIENYNKFDWEPIHNPDLKLKKYKIIVTNPPFGKGRDLKTGADGKWDLPKETVELYETWKEKPFPDKNNKIKLPNSMDKGVLFLENAYKLLEDGGRMGIVLSNSIASIREWENVRKWFINKMRIVAIFDLPSKTFGETGVSTTIIIAYKPKANEKKLLNSNYEVFVKEIKNIGYEVKTVKRSIEFKPEFIVDEKTFEKTNRIDEDFSDMQEEFSEFLKRQEEEIKKAFHFLEG